MNHLENPANVKLPKGLAIKLVNKTEIPQVTVVQLFFSLTTSYEHNDDLNWSAKLINTQGGEDTEVKILIAKEAVVGKWSQWSECPITCLSMKSPVYGISNFVVFFNFKRLKICRIKTDPKNL